MEPKTFQIPADLLQAVVGYLATRPYAEVSRLMAGMGNVIEQARVEAQSKPEIVGGKAA